MVGYQWYNTVSKYVFTITLYFHEKVAYTLLCPLQYVHERSVLYSMSTIGVYMREVYMKKGRTLDGVL